MVLAHQEDRGLRWGSALGLATFLLWGSTVLGLTPALEGQVVTIDPEPDTVLVAAQGEGGETPIRNPILALPVAAGGAQIGAGVWVWDRDALLAAVDLTLADLLSRVSGLVSVRSGDYGTPVVVTSFGLGAGQIRLFRDGIEETPMEGGVVDLSQVGLGGIGRVRVERGGSELRIDLQSLEVSDPRPLTTLDVATGDMRTNVFRLGFLHPSALGGTILVGLDRVDTDGPARREPSSAYNSLLRYAFEPRGGMSLLVESRSQGYRHGGAPGEPRALERSDLRIRGGWAPLPGIETDVAWTRTRVSPGGTALAGADSLLPSGAREGFRAGVRWEGGALSVSAAGTIHRGSGWASNGGELRLRAEDPRWGGLFLHADRQGWTVRDADSETGQRAVQLGAGAGYGLRVRGWTPSLVGVSGFFDAGRSLRGAVRPVFDPARPNAEVEVGTGAGFGNGVEGDLPEPLWVPFHARDALEIGVRLDLWSSAWVGSWFRTEADSLAPFGLPFDRRVRSRLGGIRTGFTLSGELPLNRVLPGASLSASAVFAPEPAESDAPWGYLPERSWTGAASWYRAGYDGKLEVWGDVGVRGRDGFPVPPGVLTSSPVGAVQQAPYLQSWYGRLQVRVMTVRVFILWENLAFREGNGDLPSRFQPQTRALYGIRWTMWN